MLKINCSSTLEIQHLTHTRLIALPDIIDIRCGRYAFGLYLYPVASWHWQFHIEKHQITLPTMHIEYVNNNRHTNPRFLAIHNLALFLHHCIFHHD